MHIQLTWPNILAAHTGTIALGKHQIQNTANTTDFGENVSMGSQLGPVLENRNAMVMETKLWNAQNIQIQWEKQKQLSVLRSSLGCLRSVGFLVQKFN